MNGMDLTEKNRQGTPDRRNGIRALRGVRIVTEKPGQGVNP